MQDMFAGFRRQQPDLKTPDPPIGVEDGAAFEGDRYREFFHHALQFMGVLAPDGTVVEANPAALKFAGMRRDEVIGRPFWDVAHRQIDATARDAVRDAILKAATGECVRSEVTVSGPAGLVATVAFSVRPIIDADGKATYLLAEGRDVTDRARTQGALRRSETRFAGILEIAADAIVSIDQNQKIVQFNRAAEKTFGYASADVVGRSLDFLMPERFAATHRHHVQAFGSSERPHRMVGRRVTGRRRNGEEFSAQAVVSMFEVDDEKIYTAVIRDLSDQQRREAEQDILAEAGRALTASLDYEETLRNIARLVVNDLADFCVIDIRGEDGQLRRLAAAARDPARQPLADRLQRFRVPTDRRHIAMIAWRTRRAELLDSIDDRMLRDLANDPQHLDLLRAVEPGSVIAAPMIARDRALGVILLIAQRGHRPYDRRDCALAEELGRRAAFAVDNARLYRDAQESARARQRILAIVAHDLRSPLNGITMAADMIRHYLKDDPNAAHRRPAEAILQEADRMNCLIQDLLDVRAIEGGGITVDPVPVPADVLIGDAAGHFRAECAAAGIEIILDTEPDLPKVFADRTRVARVFANLIVNAIRVTPPDGAILLKAQPCGDFVCFEVTDTGPGIPESQQERIFAPFWQGEQAGRTGDGAGLGLSIARGIIAAHGGHVLVSSSPPDGSTFTFTLPRAD